MTNKQEVVLEKCVPNHEQFTHVIGLDEVGWGAIAGPLSVSGVVLPWEFTNPGFKDSKRFSTNNSRKKGSDFAKANVLAYTTQFSLPQDVAKYGAGKALHYLQKKVVYKLLADYPKALIVVDGNKYIPGVDKAKQLTLVGADALIPAVSAASIIAKVARDEYMMALDELFPTWEFHKNKGYPTPEHLKRLKELGPTTVHRMNVTIVKSTFEKKGMYYEGTGEDQTRTACG